MSTSTTRTPKPQRETEAENSATVAQLNYDYESDKQLYLPSHWSSQNLGKFLALYPSPTAAAAACCRHTHTHTHNQQGGAGPVGKWIPGVPGRHQPVCQSSDIAQVLGGAGLSRLFSPSRDDRNIHGGAGLAFFHFFFREVSRGSFCQCGDHHLPSWDMLWCIQLVYCPEHHEKGLES